MLIGRLGPVRLSQMTLSGQKFDLDKLIALAPKASAALLAVCIAVQAFMILRDLVPALPRATASSMDGHALRGRPTQGVDVPRLVTAHLFGVAPTQGGSDVPGAAAADVQLVLVGIIASDDPLHGMAILGNSASATSLYAVTAELPGGAHLREVYRDYVVLERNGQMQTLRLPMFRMGTASVILAKMATRPAALDPDKAAAIPTVFGDIISARPMANNSTQKGFRLYPGRKGNLFSMLGLVAGDEVTAINGTPLQDAYTAAQVLQTLDSSSVVHFDVVRGGSTVNLLVDLSAIAPKIAAVRSTRNAPLVDDSST